MNIANFATVKPLFAGLGAALIIAGVQTVRLHFAESDLAVARSRVVSAITERDAAQLSYVNANEAAEDWKTVAEERLDMLTECQIERDRIDAEVSAGIAAADAAARKAKEDLRGWRAKYELAIREPTCAAARANLDASCPAEDY